MIVSIIIPCFNVEEYIDSSIKSAIQQTYRPIEVIAVDNNSTDSTFSILQKWKKKYPDLITLLQEKKQGAPAARNKGLSVAKGEWIQFLDADDLIYPDKIKSQFKLVEPLIQLIVGAFHIRKLSGEIMPVKIDNKQNPIFSIFSGGGSFGITSANLWKKSAVIAAGSWDESLTSNQEYELMFRMILTEEKAVISNNNLTCINRRVSGQITTKNPVDYAEQSLILRLEMLEKLNRMMPELTTQHFNFFENIIYSYIRLLTNIDLQKGIFYFYNYFGIRNFIPDANMPGNSKWNLTAIKYLGYRRTEKLRFMIKKFYKN